MENKQVEDWSRAFFGESGNRKIGLQKFRDLCAKHTIGASEADAIFMDLDRDGDGRISLDDFEWGFRSHLNGTLHVENEKNHYSLEKLKLIERRRSDAKLAWSHLVAGIGEPVVQKFGGNKFEKLYHDLQSAGTPPELVTRFEKTMESFLEKMNNLDEDNRKLEQMLNKEKENHLEHLKGIEEELDDQVAKIREEAREEARLEYEKEKKELLERKEREKAELEAHVNKAFSQKKEDNPSMKHAAAFENEELKSLISDTVTNLAIQLAEMSRIKADHETKCREHNSRQEVMQYVNQNHQSQLALLQKTNKTLKDTNDILLTVMESSSCGKNSPCCYSRAGSDTDSIASEKTRNIIPFADNLFYEQNQENQAQYGIKRLMEDIDSGRSTLRDGDSDHKSIPEEFSDSESKLQSLESDDSKHSHPSLRRRINKSDNVCMTPVSTMSFETTGEPDVAFKVVLAGDAAVGKSCFIHRFCKGNFAHGLGSTLGVDFQVKTIRVDDKNITLHLWDTAGQERFRSMTKTYFRRAEGVILLYDITSERSFLSISQWIESINEATDKEIPILICGNKIDMKDEAQRLGIHCVNTRHGKALARDYSALFYETSSKTGKNIMDALISISREMLQRLDMEVQMSALQVVTRTEKPLTCCRK